MTRCTHPPTARVFASGGWGSYGVCGACLYAHAAPCGGWLPWHPTARPDGAPLDADDPGAVVVLLDLSDEWTADDDMGE